jgi:hypothetical protein
MEEIIAKMGDKLNPETVARMMEDLSDDITVHNVRQQEKFWEKVEELLKREGNVCESVVVTFVGTPLRKGGQGDQGDFIHVE